MKGIRLGQVAGIAVILDWSLLIIFFLITTTLAVGLFPAWHPDWAPWVNWGTALAASVLFLLSVFLHELSHALVGRARGIDIREIHLFIFGGMAQLEHEPRNWRAEFWMAIVGPVTSVVLGLTFLFLAGTLTGPVEFDPEDAQAFFAQLGPAASLLLWLGNINIILAIFNMVPGFPLDGGRVLRALLWGMTGNLRKATRWASGMGQAFAWLLIAAGFLMVLGISVPIFGQGLGGLWLMLIGWFLNTAAVMSYRQTVIQQSLKDVPVSRLMQPSVTSVASDMNVEKLVDEYIMKSDQRAFPVNENDHLVGLICMEDIRKVSRAEWSEKRAADLMTPAAELITADPAEQAADAMERLSHRRVNQLPVMEDGRVVGLFRREDVIKWLSLRGEDISPA